MVMDTLIRHLRERDRAVIVDIQTEMLWKVHDMFRTFGFRQLMPVLLSPITDPLGPDPGSSVIKTGTIEYLGQELQLTQSMILHKQLALASGVDRFYIVSPNVRLESADRRASGVHAFEFTQVDFEIAGATMDDVFQAVEALLPTVIEHVAERCGSQLAALGRSLRVPRPPFRRYTTHELLDRYGPGWELQASLEHAEPFWVLCHQWEFYDREDPASPGHYRNYDLIYPEGFGEALSGGEREFRHRRIQQRIQRDNLKKTNLIPYLRLSRAGLLRPSAGAGFGVERLLRFLSGRRHIREVQLFPRIPGEPVVV